MKAFIETSETKSPRTELIGFRDGVSVPSISNM